MTEWTNDTQTLDNHCLLTVIWIKKSVKNKRDPSNTFLVKNRQVLPSLSHHCPEESASRRYSVAWHLCPWRKNGERQTKNKGGEFRKKSLSAIVLRRNPCLWSARFHQTLKTVCWFVCNRQCQKWGSPENKKRSSCTRTTLLLPAEQRSIQPPALQWGWHCDVNLKCT